MAAPKLEQYRDIINRYVDANGHLPPNSVLRAEMGRDTASTKQYGLGGRYTYEKQKIAVERGIATHEQLLAYRSKLGTYGEPSEAELQMLVVEELREERERRWGPRPS